MHRVGAYALRHLSREDATTPAAVVAACASEIVADWLAEKAIAWVPDSNEQGTFIMHGGKESRLSHHELRTSGGQAWRWALVEPIPGGSFCTNMEIGHDQDEVAVYCSLEVGHDTSVVAPFHFEVHCPQVIRKLVATDFCWCMGNSVVEKSPCRLPGRDGGLILSGNVRDPSRSLPIIVISEDNGFMVYPSLDVQLARITLGLANVVSIDADASWALTKSMGKDWSCFNGAVRIYWPRLDAHRNPFMHPLWTADTIMEGVATTQLAANRIERRIKELLFELGVLGAQRPHLLVRLEEQRREEERSEKRKLAGAQADLSHLVDDVDKENHTLRDRIRQLEEENLRLRIDVENARLIARMSDATSAVAAVLAPETRSPALTVLEAVDRAREDFKTDIVFGKDVDKGLRDLAENAGPPDKIEKYLGLLAQAARLRRKGELKVGFLQWLRERGAMCSAEEKKLMADRKERSKRTYHDGKTRRPFEMHLKPSEATAPDRCVRIYFDWDEAVKFIIVGWVGRHP